MFSYFITCSYVYFQTLFDLKRHPEMTFADQESLARVYEQKWCDVLHACP